jgi:4a-hydroxytetrahydrobiopterin dehydratase
MALLRRQGPTGQVQSGALLDLGERIAMASTLADKSCTPCRGGVPPLSRETAEEFHRQSPDWALLDEAARIERTYRFKNFAEAFAFVERAAALAEAEGHHPDICFGWGYATVSLRTKKIKGLHENDFIMAAKLDRLATPVEAG